ncbi:MAG: DNA adenine methylase [Bacteroidaceae bacterium]|nr:DNA adenine methylase [Bacteroidaceae bacterium]
MNRYIAKPFVKWVGGKTQLLEEVRKSLPSDMLLRNELTYVEPFVGGGAVLFWILQTYPNIKRAIINDINSELICTYRVIQSNVEGLINILMDVQRQYVSLNAEGRKEYFLEKRKLYNSKKCSEIETAALFIFLNRTCFNGLYRVNSKGEFNVPHGRYSNPKICNKENLLAVSALLQRVEILCGDFEKTEVYAGENAIFYLDPPYKPMSETSSFTSYTKNGFDDAEQVRLRDFCTRIAENKTMFVASNSDPHDVTGCSFFERIYRQFNIRKVFATRLINANSDGRGLVSEIMISNVINI